jgi:Cof subfamily protein (haloacid dehalogenase superfamily)
MIKLLVTDMDGTCLNSQKEISLANREAIRALHAKGILVALATGRLDRSIRAYARELQLSLPIISCNGALVRDMNKGEIIFEAPLPQELCLRVLQTCRELEATLHLSCEEDMIITEEIYPRLKLLSDWNDTLTPENQFRLKLVRDIQEPVRRGIKVYKVIAWSRNSEFLRELQGKLKAIPGVEAVQSEDVLLDIGVYGIDKGTAVARLAEDLGLSPQEVMTIGDHDNDLGMVRYAGLGVAMANGSPRLMEAADYITGSNDEDGLAEAIWKFILL